MNVTVNKAVIPLELRTQISAISVISSSALVCALGQPVSILLLMYSLVAFVGLTVLGPNQRLGVGMLVTSCGCAMVLLVMLEASKAGSAKGIHASILIAGAEQALCYFATRRGIIRLRIVRWMLAGHIVIIAFRMLL